jgi:DNA processing protein
MSYEVRKLTTDEFPSQLLEIPQPPKELWVAGTLPPEEYLHLVVVGSRKYSSYGKEVCEKLISGLAGHPICIISGLALGIDTLAHKVALKAGLPTIAVPGSGLNEKILYPASNQGLAREILSHGGCLLSEFAPDFRATVWSFPQRNRIMAGLARAVLIIEAEEKSGTLITSRLATDYNRDVFAVPGSIFSENSKGTHMLIRLGATPITSSEDILEALGIEITSNESGVLQSNTNARIPLTDDEHKIFELIAEPIARDLLIYKSGMPITQITALLSVMEIKGLIREFMGEIHRN